MTLLSRLLLAAAVLILPLAGAFAQESPLTARGFSVDKAYQVHDVDSINTFNGNVNVTIPIGQRYTVSNSLSYQLYLSYGGNVWDFDYDYFDEMDPVTGETTHRRIEWAIIRNDNYNAGLGWRLSLGYLEGEKKDGAYISPDGAKHEFYAKLHDEASTVADIAYTRDGTYLRRTYELVEGTSGAKIEFPDGTIHRFDYRGDLRSISDQFGNVVTIEYTLGSDGARDWTIYDGHRKHTVDMMRRTRTNAPDEKDYNVFDVVKQVVFNVPYCPAPATCESGDAARPSNATYTFNYANDDNFARLSRKLAARQDCNISEVAWAAILESVDMPHGATYTFVTDRGDATAIGGTYSTPEGTATHLQPGATCPNPYTVPVHASYSGHLTKVTTPTRGSVGWTYQTYVFPPLVAGGHADCVPGGGLFSTRCQWSHSKRESFGVKERFEYDRSGNVVTKRTYTPSRVSSVSTATAITSLKTYTVGGTTQAPTYTLHSDEVNYYSTPGYFQTQDEIDFGLPYTTDSTLTPPGQTNPDSAGRYLSSILYDGSGNVLRYRYVNYEFDQPHNTYDISENRRLKRSREVLLGSGGTVHSDISTLHENFDFFGHYRTTTVSPTGSTTDYRKTTTTFNTRFENPPGTFNLPAKTEPWVLGTYDHVEVEEMQASVTLPNLRTDACFAASGFLLWNRVRRGTSASSNDLLTVFNDVAGSEAADGNVSRVDYYGGDVQPLTSGSVTCPLGTTTVGTPQYQIVHTYQNGALASSQYLGADYKSLDLTINKAGFPTSTRDASGVETTMVYDELGRVVTITPAGGVPTAYTYGAATASAQASVTISRPCSTCGSTGPGDVKHYYDDFGRLILTKQQLPPVGSTVPWSAKWVGYDSLGRKKDETVAASTSSGAYESRPSTVNATTWVADVLGRATSVTLPDNSVTSFSYGAQTTTRESQVLTNSGLATAKTRETYDYLGRLASVVEDVDGSPLTTSYGYDAGGRLVSVNGPREANVASRTPRTFTYDAAGLLTGETHPENGTSTYTMFDARGHATYKRRLDCLDDLKFTFDATERLTAVAAHRGIGGVCNENEWRTLKSFTFETSPFAPVGSRAKLKTSMRLNALHVGFVHAVENFTYDTKGRVTGKTTDIYADGMGSRNQRFEQQFAYDSFDRLISSQYPTCVDVGCGAAPYDGATLTYNGGPLSGVAAAVSNGTALTAAQSLAAFTYHPSGMAATIAHANQVTDTIEADPTGIARPKQYTYSGYTDGCSAPTVSVSPASTSVVVGSTVTFTATYNGTGPLSLQWYDTYDNPIPGATSSTYTTPALSSSQSYKLHVTSGCGKAIATASVTVTIPTPTGLVATRTASASITVTWQAVSGVAGYDIQRRAGSGYTSIGTSTTTSFVDNLCQPGMTCVYRVAATSGSLKSAYSAPDLASILTFTSVNTSLWIDNAHVEEILAAVNSLRAAAGVSALTWGSILPVGVASPADGAIVAAEHVLALRTSMDAARTTLGVANTAYTDSLDVITLIKALHITELQQRTQ